MRRNGYVNDCPREFKPALYRRYGDDCFLLVSSESQAAPFLQYLNSQHPTIEFTCEREFNNNLVFLYILITKTPTSFDTSVFRKNILHGLGLRFDSFVFNHHKFDLVQCLVDRAYKILSSYMAFSVELDFLKRYLSRKNFPNAFIESCFRIKLHSIFCPDPVLLTVRKMKMKLKMKMKVYRFQRYNMIYIIA